MSITTTTKHKVRGTSQVADLGYQHPSDWVTVPAMGSTEVAYFVVAVDDVSHNKVNITFDTHVSNDTFDVDWGDGTTSTNVLHSAGGTVHDYDYSTLSATVTSEGFKTALITVTPSSGNTGTFRTLDISKGGLTDREFWRVSNFLEVHCNLPDIEHFYQASNSTKHRRMRYINVKSYDVSEVHIGSYMSSLEFVDLPWQPTSDTITTVAQAFAFCHNLKRAPYFDTSGVTDASEMFINCGSLNDIPDYDMSSATDTELMFAGCESLEAIPNLKLGSVTTMSQFADGATSLKVVPQLDTSTVTNMNKAFKDTAITEFPNLNVGLVTNFQSTWENSKIKTLPELNFTTSQANFAYTFKNCKELQYLPDSLEDINPNNVYGMFEYAQNLQRVPVFTLTNAGSCGRMFYNAYSLIVLPAFNFTGKTSSQLSNAFVSATSLKRVLATGFQNNVNIYGDLSGEAIDELFTNLPTVSSATITLTAHWGFDDATPSIATAKGWTVAGSDTE
jgi:surface protein